LSDNSHLNILSVVAVVVSIVALVFGVVLPQAGDLLLSDLGDVQIGTPIDGDVLVYDASLGKWVDGNDVMLNSPLTIGSLGGNASFESDGTLMFYGNGTYWRDSAVEGTALTKGAAAPDIVNIPETDLYLPGFDGANTIESLYGSLEISHDYKEGTPRYTHIHWIPSTKDTGDVVWFLQLILYDSETGTHTVQSLVNATGTANGSGMMVISEFPPINGTGVKIEQQLIFRLYRDPSNLADTYPGDALISTIGSHYEVDTLGSRTMQTK
jgi:hypothetical protein